MDQKYFDPSRHTGNPLSAPEVNMFVIVRAVTYAALFIGLVLVYVPARLLSWSGIVRPAAIDVQQAAGMVIGAVGAAVALWCIFTFAATGRGTPAPFDPPRRLVIAGPYRFVRNPMYIGAGLALAGAALFYESLPLLGYAGTFLLATHLFVVLYEERSLRQTFGQAYEAYCCQVRRWRPSVRNRT
jgi:protein-S-isoprenylcysteine O-methyltransferase Ste14